MNFENAYTNSKPQKVFDILGSPFFEDEQKLDDDYFKIEFTRLKKLLVDYDINVDFIAQRPDRFKYDFITKELFDHETGFIAIKGMTTDFIYEEFHPDHKQEITDITFDFLNDFLERKLNVDTCYISDELIEPDGKVVSKEELMNRFDAMYEVFPQFANKSFNLGNVDFELKEKENSPGMGFSEGEINYDVIMEDGRKKEIRGPFKIYFARQWDCWIIYFFYLAGYNLHPTNNF